MGRNQPLELSEEGKKGAATRKKPNYSPRDQLAFDVLAEFGVATSHAITDIMGEEQAEALVRNEVHNAMLAMILNIKNRMALEGQYSLSPGYVENWPTYIIGLDQKVEITSIGFRWLATSCPWFRATDALCYKSGQYSKTVAEILAPDYTASNPKRLSRGDDTCLIIFAKKGVDPDQVLNAPCICEPLPPPLDLEEMALWNHSYMGNMWALLLKSMLAEIGPEITMNALESKFKEIGRGFAKRFNEEYKITTDDLGSVVDGLNSFHSSFLKKGWHKGTSDGFSIATEECPYSGEPPEVCQLFQCFYDGLLEEINSELVMSVSTMMTKGDKTCNWTLRKKNEARKEESKEEAPLDDPVKLLTLMYVRDEITEEEFRKKLTVLKELKL